MSEERTHKSGATIEFCDIHKYFGENWVLRGLSLQVRAGETLVILGRSGCGKSVLLKILLGLIRPESGEVWFDGTELTSLSERQLVPFRTQIGMLFQGSALFDSLTVGENVAYWLREHTRLSEEEIAARVAECLRFVEMEGTEELMPSELSGGMRKRVALARAMISMPRVMLYDEPTTGLDPITATTINALIRKTQHELGVTSIVVTHELESAFSVANRLAVIHEGVIVAVGTKEEVQASDNEFVRTFLAGPK
ncbi:MAG: ABC transporter ATP-binding protein [candidate division KSB1 bacterium]|nr:ABC transporter ATP-binding protein [candidate division KSB1 bacterium]MDZ7379549.1 ABC transporter ATP-binding protein [candidate division KSB1 bacterium]MDZ7385009.1 ABC transporter ATP-binding protein [candidate division KSB1 bacterium]MDZ7391684.1 ABC transporter ATP-binding protein [candidate division KSB1 bacterium]